MEYTVGIDIGGTNTRIALIDDQYHIQERLQFATNVEDALTTLNQIKQRIEAFGIHIRGVGLSCPGPLDIVHGVIETPPNLGATWHALAIGSTLQKMLAIPVYLDNDANLACLGEAVLGAGKTCNYVQYLTISTGIGAGFVVNKHIYHGSHGVAQEIANIPLWRNGPQHGSIYAGGVEAICSGTAITTRARKAGLLVHHAGEVHELAEAGNRIAKEIMEDAMHYLASAIAILYACMDPEIVILAGSVALKIYGFIDEIERRVKEMVYVNLRSSISIVRASLDEDGGLLGAACLVHSRQHMNT